LIIAIINHEREKLIAPVKKNQTTGLGVNIQQPESAMKMKDYSETEKKSDEESNKSGEQPEQV
jgi:hypothetical protein